jgi:hypothetical protein
VYLQNEEAKKFCNAEVFLNASRPASEAAGPRGSSFYTFRLPLAQFKCDYEGAMLSDITNISFENANARRGFVCIARVAILRDDQADSGSASNSNNTGTAETGRNSTTTTTTSGSGGGSAERR